MNKKNIVVFGTGPLSSLAAYCLTMDSRFSVVSFTVDQAYLAQDRSENLPVVAFEKVESHFPPEYNDMIIPIGFSRINGLRRERFLQAREKGYGLISYISGKASVWPDFQINHNVLIYEHAVVQPFSSVGENTIIRSAAHVSHHCNIGNHAFIAAGATLGGNVGVGERAFIGLGAVIRDGITIAPRTFIGAGAVIISDTEPDGVYVGNPARKLMKNAMAVTRA